MLYVVLDCLFMSAREVNSPCDTLLFIKYFFAFTDGFVYSQFDLATFLVFHLAPLVNLTGLEAGHVGPRTFGQHFPCLPE